VRHYVSARAQEVVADGKAGFQIQKKLGNRQNESTIVANMQDLLASIGGGRFGGDDCRGENFLLLHGLKKKRREL